MCFAIGPVVPQIKSKVGRTKKPEQISLGYMFVRAPRDSGPGGRNVSHDRHIFFGDLIRSVNLREPAAVVAMMMKAPHGNACDLSVFKVFFYISAPSQINPPSPIVAHCR